MHKTGIRFNRKDFEYDVYSLVRAFYPHSDTEMYYEGEEPAGEYELLLLVTYQTDGIELEILREGRTALARKVPVEFDRDRQETKNVLKRLVYDALKELTGNSLPWGDLTGIRPTKIPMKLLEEGWKNTDIAGYMRQTYEVSDAKCALAITIANRERAILRQFDYEKGWSLYVGIPFCPSICLYCSFGSHPLEVWKKRVDEYLDALIRELTFIRDQMAGRPLHSVYIGGGTPTTLTPEQSRRLLGAIEELFDLSHVREYTVEAGRPDTITGEKLQVLRHFPVSRISINPQTMNQKTLDLIGRKHTVEDVVRIFGMARELGFDNINMDLIVGLPGEGETEVDRTLSQVEQLGPDSLTVHSLALKRATRLNLFKDQYEEISFANSAAIMDHTQACARRMGMGPYYLYRQKNIAGNFENVGYARPGCEGLYNILIMEEKQSIIAAGAGASTKFVFDGGRRIERAENVKSVDQYISRLDEMIERKRAGIEKYLRPDA